MAWWWTAAAGAVLGAGIALLLRTGSYRRGAEKDRPIPPASAIALAAVALAASWALGATAGGGSGMVAATLLFSIVGLIASWIDVDVHRIPNVVTGTAAAVTVASLTVEASLTGEWLRLGQAVLAGLGLMAVFVLLTMVSSFGAGDAKFAGVAGLVLGWAGWSTVIVGLMAAFVVAAIVAVVLLGSGRSRHSHLPFGPALAIGTIIAIAV